MALRKTLLGAAALSLALGAAAPASAQTEIVFWHAMADSLGEATNRLVDLFNESQDDVHVTAIYRGTYEETITAGIAAFRADQAPNIIQIFDAGAATIIGAEGAVIPVQDLFEQAGVAFNIDDYVPGVKSFYADADGKMIGMPFNSSTPVLYYNVDALEAAGVEPPRTWEEFEEIAPKLVEAGYIPLSQSHLPWIMSENFSSRHNIPLANNANGFAGAQDAEILFNNEHLIFHFEKMKEWKDEGLFGFYGVGWGDNQTPFEAGEVAMWLGSSASAGGMLERGQVNFSTTFLPYWSAITEGEEFGTFIGGAALFAMAGHSDEENAAVARFFAFLGEPAPQFQWHRETGYVPITTAAYDFAKEQGFYEERPDAEVATLQLSKQSAENNQGYRLGFYVQIREVMNREYERFFNGEVSAEEAFATIEEEANQLLERFARTLG